MSNTEIVKRAVSDNKGLTASITLNIINAGLIIFLFTTFAQHRDQARLEAKVDTVATCCAKAEVMLNVLMELAREKYR